MAKQFPLASSSRLVLDVVQVAGVRQIVEPQRREVPSIPLHRLNPGAPLAQTPTKLQCLSKSRATAAATTAAAAVAAASVATAAPPPPPLPPSSSATRAVRAPDTSAARATLETRDPTTCPEGRTTVTAAAAARTVGARTGHKDPTALDQEGPEVTLAAHELGLRVGEVVAGRHLEDDVDGGGGGDDAFFLLCTTKHISRETH
ncbi:hypothetical protein F5B21DRAFT_499794 [Xylaria acuta]|nr:hypothetical protein F5B21DRAFT_499794 [Xylaria acuta]